MQLQLFFKTTNDKLKRNSGCFALDFGCAGNWYYHAVYCHLSSHDFTFPENASSVEYKKMSPNKRHSICQSVSVGWNCCDQILRTGQLESQAPSLSVLEKSKFETRRPWLLPAKGFLPVLTAFSLWPQVAFLGVGPYSKDANHRVVAPTTRPHLNLIPSHPTTC